MSAWHKLSVVVERGGYAPANAASIYPMSGEGVIMFIPRLGVRLGSYDDATGDWWVQDTNRPDDAGRRNPEALLNFEDDQGIMTPTHWMRMPEPPEDDPAPREQCSVCRFWLRGSGQLGAQAGEDYGVCARHAPTPRLMADPRGDMGDDAYIALWPETAAQEWCGEWSERKSPAWKAQ